MQEIPKEGGFAVVKFGGPEVIPSAFSRITSEVLLGSQGPHKMIPRVLQIQALTRQLQK